MTPLIRVRFSLEKQKKVLKMAEKQRIEENKKLERTINKRKKILKEHETALNELDKRQQSEKKKMKKL